MKPFFFLLSFTFILSSASATTSPNASGYPFQVSTSGSGTRTALFIPGFSCSGDEWQTTLPLFSATYTCYTFTMAGFAGVPPQDSVSFAYWEKSIVAFIRDKKIDKPVIVGHSMGGGLAMAIAADFPGLAEKIIVVDALPCLAAVMDPAFKSKIPNDCSAMVARMTGMSNDQFAQMQKMTIARMLGDSTKRDMVVGWSVASDRRTMGAMYCDFVNTDLREKIGNVQCPVLVLLEAYFMNIKPAIEKQFAAMKTADLRYAGQGLHFIMYDDPAWYAGQINQFIKP